MEYGVITKHFQLDKHVREEISLPFVKVTQKRFFLSELFVDDIFITFFPFDYFKAP